MRRIALLLSILALAACPRQAPPPSSSGDSRPTGDETERQSQRADTDNAVGAANHTTPGH